MTKPLNETEKAMLADLLDRLGDYLGAAGCNDCEVTVTRESRPILVALAEACDDEEGAADRKRRAKSANLGSEVIVMDFQVLSYLRGRLGL